MFCPFTLTSKAPPPEGTRVTEVIVCFNLSSLSVKLTAWGS